MLIGITGGIGAGKSVVSRILRLKGFEVYDCDSRARELMESDDEILSALSDRFGERLIQDDGSLDRALIAEEVFTSDETRIWLNTLVHSVVRNDLEQWHDSSDDDLCFVESAIMVTSGLDKMCDRIWLIDAPLQLRKERALKRGGVSPENLDLRIAAQSMEFDALPPEKIVIIENSYNSSLLTQIEMLLNSKY